MGSLQVFWVPACLSKMLLAVAFICLLQPSSVFAADGSATSPQGQVRVGFDASLRATSHHGINRLHSALSRKGLRPQMIGIDDDDDNYTH